MDVGANLAAYIFNGPFHFEEACLELFRFQYGHNRIYKRYVDALGVQVASVSQSEQIPFLPIRFFKTHEVRATSFKPDLVFESSGTTETINSKHEVKDARLYERSFNRCFEQFYGQPQDWCVLGLLPSYLERKNSSLVYMVRDLVDQSAHVDSGFYLHDWERLAQTLHKLEAARQPTLLIGVTFALLDFAEKFQLPLRYTTLMETGGMKGRRKEMIRTEVHERLKKAFSLESIHSEYGMTELLSQAYSKRNGVFNTPPWMRVLLRDENDPLSIKSPAGNEKTRGLINVIDLANIYSCSFIATDDLGVLHNDGSFEVTGRMDHSDLRGCSLLAL